MGLRDDILEEQSGTSQGVEYILSQLPEEEREELEELLTDPLIKSTSIHRVLTKKRGFEISERTIQRYRKDLT